MKTHINSYHKYQGLVLATNLLMVLLVTLIATTLFKNALTQSKMVNLSKSQLLIKNNSEQVLVDAKNYIKNLLAANTELTVNDKGYFGSDAAIFITDINWQDTNNFIASDNNSKFVVIYLGIQTKLTQPDLGLDHHLFKILIYSQFPPSAEYQLQRFIAIPVV
ncbi:hypothetical protein RI844_08090 [Thalassotalea fonticola]|uniref:Type 4 fimbrial biogenesis protein PilX N-terminal domain-containing protein n=1 Tax=Thalassotalea fonticola TaxID=3065649 RepID=A0ABZ0GU28_9GAMM|nr:hypothetical protein RI844_08090 [Colwelliaceae bacterium S1-1]